MMTGITEKHIAGAKNNRKPAKVLKNMVAQFAATEPLRIEDMVLRTEGGWSARFERLTYKGCPTFNTKNKKNLDIEYIDMERNSFVREMYRLFKPKFNISLNTRFKSLCKYIAWLDMQGLTCINGDYFHNELIKKYMLQWGEWVQKGRYKINSWSAARALFSWILKEFNRHSDVNLLPNIKGQNKSTESYKGYDLETELKPTSKALFRGYIGLAKHLAAGTSPTFHPIYDEQLFNIYCSKNTLTTK